MYILIGSDIHMVVTCLIMVHHWISSRGCEDTKKHPPHRFMPSYVVKGERNFTGDIFRSPIGSLFVLLLEILGVTVQTIVEVKGSLAQQPLQPTVAFNRIFNSTYTRF